ncbi:MAG TPA: MarR family transcriptional regulator [Propionibacteriaceae bacterium]|nr:MarR family transcriptional regulator [Propionibacteriaceae bacterium]
MTKSADSAAPQKHSKEATERRQLIAELEHTREESEHRALSAMVDPLMSTPLTMQQLRVLAIIAVDPDNATGQNLAEMLQVSLASMSGMIDRLVDHGMVERTEDPADRRVRRLHLTPEGNKMLGSLMSTAGTVPAPVLEQMELADLRALVRGMHAVDRVARQLDDTEE